MSQQIEAIHDVKCKMEGRECYPRVAFAAGEITVLPETFTSEVRGVGTSKRVQVPLGLAWALTVHKSQGMSLERMSVSLMDVFMEGQAYVALSRATCKAGLRLQGFKHSCVRASPIALAFERGQAVPTWLQVAQQGWAEKFRLAMETAAKENARTYPTCHGHGEQAKRMQVKKEGRNQGKWFFSCPMWRRQDKCSFFKWDDGQ